MPMQGAVQKFLFVFAIWGLHRCSFFTKDCCGLQILGPFIDLRNPQPILPAMLLAII